MWDNNNINLLLLKNIVLILNKKKNDFPITFHTEPVPQEIKQNSHDISDLAQTLP